jgi:Rrf2 family transcriptional regulator, nitric oxide-sensitive transcriptional repressor
MFSQTAEYAMRAMVWLATHTSHGRVDNKRIAEGTQVPVTYLAKIMQQLVEAQLVESRRGVGGGFILSCDPVQTRVLDVINAVDPIQRITSCPLNLSSHKKRRCSMHANLDEALAGVERVLANTSIADIIADETLPIPMRESKRR